MRGFDTTQLVGAVRADSALVATTVVTLTRFDEEVAGARRCGADIALSKTRVGELLALLVRVLRERQRRAAGGASD
jgi:hypothetical protein